MKYDLAPALALARVALGTCALLTPRGVLALAHLDSAAPQSAYLLRLFGAREAALGVAALLASDYRTSFLSLGLAVDGLDAAAGVAA